MLNECPAIRATMLLLLFAGACSSDPPANVDHLVVEDAKGVPVPKMSCDEPVVLERDCSSLRGGAQRIIEVDRVELQIAGSADGRHVLVMPSHIMKKALSLDPGILTLDANTAYYRVKQLLNSRGIQIMRVIPSASKSLVVGYLLELDGDGYAILKEFSK